MLRFFIACLLCVALCPAQQTISVGNAASLAAALAPGSILSIQQLKPPQIVGPVDPSRVSVQIRPSGSTATLDAPLLPSPLLAIWAQLPASTPLGSADVTLTVDGQASAPARITVTRTNFGLFTQAGNGLGAALAQNQDDALNKLTRPVLPGQYVTLWGTGLGSVALSEVTLQLGGTKITPAYAGPAPTVPGVDQINFQVPDAGIPDGCYVSVVVNAGGILSNEATLAKASRPGPCEHPFGLSAAEMASLDSGGRILFGAVRLQSDVGVIPFFGSSPGAPTELAGASAQFLRRDAFEIGLLAQPLTSDDSYFGCRVTPPSGAIGLLFAADVDAGNALTLTGPGQSITLPRSAGLYDASAFAMGQSLFVPGSWRIEGPGGANIAPFHAELTLPPPVCVANRDSLTMLDLGQDQYVLWDPSGYSDTDVATVTLSLSRLAALGLSGSQIRCRTPASTGALTIPSPLLQTLPPGSASLRLGIAPRPNRRVLFSLPLTDGSSAQAFFDYSFSETISTQMR